MTWWWRVIRCGEVEGDGDSWCHVGDEYDVMKEDDEEYLLVNEKLCCCVWVFVGVPANIYIYEQSKSKTEVLG